MKFALNTMALTVGAACLAGCGAVGSVRQQIDAVEPHATKTMAEPLHIVDTPRVQEKRGTMLTAKEVKGIRTDGAWLRLVRVSLDAPRPIPLTQAIAQFAAKGVNISSDLPLDGVMFAGTINQTDGESGLRQLLGSVGLDYKVDDERKLVTVKPISSRTWYLNLGRRVTSYASTSVIDPTTGVSGGSGASGGSSGGGSSGGNQAGGTPVSGGSASGASSGGSTSSAASGQGSLSGSVAGSSSMSSSSGGNNTGVSGTDDFWSSLAQELASRLTVMVPVSVTKGAQSGANSAQPGVIVPNLNGQGAGGVSVVGMSDPTSGQLYVPKRIGTFALNPETGAITVQAPSWLLSDIDATIKRDQQMYNTVLSFEGELVLVSGTDNHSEGFDVQDFAKFAASRYGAIISNSPLNGVTVSAGNGSIPTVAAGSQTVGGALVGIQSAKDGLQIFNAYLGQLGKFAIKQSPVVTTTSGVPGQFSNMQPKYYNLVSQAVAAGNSGAATQATSNTLLQKNFGTALKVYPRFDMATGLVRAQVDVSNVIYAGDQIVPQYASAGTTVQQIPQTIPLEKYLNVSGEALFRDGDLIIIGGQSESTLQTTESGLPLGDVPIGGVLGTKTSTNERGTYYFALRVSIKKR